MKFKWKVFTSLTLTLNFFLASISGIALFLTPRGRIANWTDWSLLGLDKDGWTAIHLSSITLMLVFGILHLFWFNWKPFLGYLGKKMGKSLRYPVEIVITVVLFLIVFFGTLYEVPGVIAVEELREWIKDSYEVQKDQPPIPHAEELTVAQFSRQILQKPTSIVLKDLEKLGWKTDDKDILLADLAKQYNISPKQIMDSLGGSLEEAVKEDTKSENNADAEKGTHGYGYGRMTLKEMCDGNSIDVNSAVKKLDALGVKGIDGSSKVKEIADRMGIKPNEVLKKLQD